MADPDIHIGVSDAERSDTMRQLADGVAQGRLDLNEFKKRTDRAPSAVTRVQLSAITGDLPPDGQSAARRDGAEWLLEWRWWLAGAVVLNGLWVVQWLVGDDAEMYWPAVPLAVWALILVGVAIAPSTSPGGTRPAIGHGGPGNRHQ
jgi:hypothetical protein